MRLRQPLRCSSSPFLPSPPAQGLRLPSRCSRQWGADANKLKTFCEMMQIETKMGEVEVPVIKAQIDKLLDQLGADFKAAWNTVVDVDDDSPDGKVLNAALEQLEDKCPD
jgi:hypothetical protein